MGGGGGKQTTKAEIPDELKPLYRSTANQMMIAQNANPMAGPSAWWSGQGRRYYNAPLNDQYYEKVAGYDYPAEAAAWGDEHQWERPDTAWNNDSNPGSGGPRPKGGGGNVTPPKFAEPDKPWNVGGQPPPEYPGNPKGGGDNSNQPSGGGDPTANMTPAERAMYWQQIADQQGRGGGSGDNGGGSTGGGTSGGDTGGGGSSGGTGNWWDDLPYSIPGMDDPGGPSDPRSGEPWVAQPGTWRNPQGGGGNKRGDIPPPKDGFTTRYNNPPPMVNGKPASGGGGGQANPYANFLGEGRKLATAIGGK